MVTSSIAKSRLLSVLLVFLILFGSIIQRSGIEVFTRAASIASFNQHPIFSSPSGGDGSLGNPFRINEVIQVQGTGFGTYVLQNKIVVQSENFTSCFWDSHWTNDSISFSITPEYANVFTPAGTYLNTIKVYQAGNPLPIASIDAYFTSDPLLALDPSVSLAFCASSTPVITTTTTTTSTVTATGSQTTTTTPTFTDTPTSTSSTSTSATATFTNTETSTPTGSATLTPSDTFTPTETETNTSTASGTASPTSTLTPTSTQSNTTTFTQTFTPTPTFTPTNTYTTSNTPTSTNTPTPTPIIADYSDALYGNIPSTYHLPTAGVFSQLWLGSALGNALTFESSVNALPGEDDDGVIISSLAGIQDSSIGTTDQFMINYNEQLTIGLHVNATSYSSPYTCTLLVWIDWNKNGQADGADTYLYNHIYNATSPVIFYFPQTVSVPAPFLNDPVLLRARIFEGNQLVTLWNAPAWASSLATNGEVEDYLLYTHIATNTPTVTPTTTATATTTATPSYTSTQTNTITATFTPTASKTSTPTNTQTSTATTTITNTGTFSSTPTIPTNTVTQTYTPTSTYTLTVTATVPTNTATTTTTSSYTVTSSSTETPSSTATTTSTPTATQIFVCSSPNLFIPDNNATGISNTITIPTPASKTRNPLADLNVSLDITHTFVGDLIVTLKNDDTGMAITLIDRPGYPPANGCLYDNIQAILDDEALTSVEATCTMNNPLNSATTPAIGGSLIPTVPLWNFDDMFLEGSWTITVSDRNNGDGGRLNSWCLSYETAPEITISPTFTATGTNTATSTASQTPTATATDTATQTPSNTSTDTPTYTFTPTPSHTPTDTFTATPTFTPTNTATATSTPFPATPDVYDRAYTLDGLDDALNPGFNDDDDPTLLLDNSVVRPYTHQTLTNGTLHGTFPEQHNFHFSGDIDNVLFATEKTSSIMYYYIETTNLCTGIDQFVADTVITLYDPLDTPILVNDDNPSAINTKSSQIIFNPIAGGYNTGLAPLVFRVEIAPLTAANTGPKSCYSVRILKSSNAPTATITATHTTTSTHTITDTPTITYTSTVTDTFTPTATVTLTPTKTASNTRVPSLTYTPSSTATPTATNTPKAPISMCSSPNIAIPDANLLGISSTLTIPANGNLLTLTDLNVYLRINHTYVQDLSVSLVHNSTGTLVPLMSSFACPYSNVDAVFDDTASGPASCYSLPVFPQVFPAIFGQVQPTGVLALFTNLDFASTWTLKVSDNAVSNTGTLISWCLQPQFTASTFTPTATATATFTKTATNTATATFTKTNTATPTNTKTPTSSYTATNTRTASNTSTATFTKTPTLTRTPTLTKTNTSTPTNTKTPTNSFTATNTSTASYTRTPTFTRTATFTRTPTFTKTNTNTPTYTRTPTSTKTATSTHTASNTPTATFTSTPKPPYNYCVSPNRTIPDANLTGISSTISVPANATVMTLTDLNVFVQINHTYLQDLTVTLKHNTTGTVVTLLELSSCLTYDNIGAVFDDAAGNPADATCFAGPLSAISGFVSPTNPLSVFNGLNFASMWTLNVSDNAPLDTGRLVSWCLQPMRNVATFTPTP